MPGIDRSIVDAVIDDYRTAPISSRLAAVLAFIEKLTRDPSGMTSEDARDALAAGATTADLTDAAAVASLFNIITRYANALDFEIPSEEDFARSAHMLLRRGYS